MGPFKSRVGGRVFTWHSVNLKYEDLLYRLSTNENTSETP